MSKSIKKYWIVIVPIIAAYFYNMFLGTIDVSFFNYGSFVEIFKFLIIYNILFSALMLVLKKVFKVNIKEIFTQKLAKVLIRK